MKVAILAAIAMAVAACGPENANAPGAKNANAAADFSLPSLDGRTVHLSDYEGKVVLVDFWSTTCDPCMAEMPHLVELYKKHKDDGFVVLAVSLDGPESRAQVSSIVSDKQMIFPVLLDEETTVVARFDPKREMPFSVLVGRDGGIIFKRPGYKPGDETSLAKEIEDALSKK